jgi:hypothetical protein
MIWRKDIPTESPIVAYREGSNTPEILVFAQGYYYDIDCHEVTIDKIQKWASLSETPTPSNLDEAAEDSWAKCEYRESPRGLYYTCYVDGFKAGAELRDSQMKMPNSSEFVSAWSGVKSILQEKDFRGDEWRLAYNAFMFGFSKGLNTRTEKK